MNEHYLRNVIEAALLAAGRPVQPAELIQLYDENARPTMEQIRAALDALAAEYAERGIELKETASGVRIQVRRELAGEVSRLWPERPARYSRALLETLALIAYRQPITRGEIEGVRGVAVNPNIIKTLLERNWVRVVGTRDVPGRPELLGTTRDFLDYFGLKSLDELPPLSELKAVGDINLQLDLQGQPGPQAAQTDGEAAPGPDSAAEAGASAEAGEPQNREHAVTMREPQNGEHSVSMGESQGGEHPVSMDELQSDERRRAMHGRGASREAASGTASTAANADSNAPTSAAESPSDEALLEGTAEDAVNSRAVGGDAIDESAVNEGAIDDDDDSEDEDELSAEGGDSHELVAAPRDSSD